MSVTRPLPIPDRAESVFTYAAPTLVYGSGAINDVPSCAPWPRPGPDHHRCRGCGHRCARTCRGVVASSGPRGACVRRFSRRAHRCQPSTSDQRGAGQRAGDAFVAVGGGSSIDTAKAVNLLTTNPGALLDYVNAPIGGGQAPTQPLKPLVAVPTTTGTGSESTTICVPRCLDRHVKTGISHARLRPTLAVVDPDLTTSQPPMVTASAGLDILCHALESYTARPYTSFEAKSAEQRVPYCGANPVSDMWAQRALSLMAESFVAAVRNGDDARARADMALAATLAGMGFGNAGVHIPHANAYPIAGRVREYRPSGYPHEEPLIPHGMAVALTAPAAFRLTFEASPSAICGRRGCSVVRATDPISCRQSCDGSWTTSESPRDCTRWDTPRRTSPTRGGFHGPTTTARTRSGRGGLR